MKIALFLLAFLSTNAFAANCATPGKTVLVLDQTGRVADYVAKVATTECGWLTLSSGEEVNASDVSCEVSSYNEFTTGQTVTTFGESVEDYFGAKPAKILYVFANGQAQVELLEDGYFAKGHQFIVPVAEIE